METLGEAFRDFEFAGDERERGVRLQRFKEPREERDVVGPFLEVVRFEERERAVDGLGEAFVFRVLLGGVWNWVSRGR